MHRYKGTLRACFTGYIVQAVIGNFAPLLFLTFQREYAIPLSQITLLISVKFAVQLLVDLLSAGFVDKLGYRVSIVMAHAFAAAGLILLTVLPGVLQSPFAGLMAAVVIYAVGGGLIEVLISPMVEATPSENKEKMMSLLHSFYCWGQVGVVLLSTLFFQLFGTGSWRVLALIWAALPAVNAVVFLRVPIASLEDEGRGGLALRSLLTKKIFWVLLLLMLCAGASEQAVSQWASTFAENALGIGKTAGDLAGPMAFALLMGISRAIFGKYGDRLNLDKFMLFSTLLCIASYLCIALVPVPAISLIGCALCGLSVGILWPGTFSKASSGLPAGGTAMFALLALAGDLGCTAGPTVAGIVSSRFGDNLRAGTLAAIVFPLLLLTGLLLYRRLRPAGKRAADATQA